MRIVRTHYHELDFRFYYAWWTEYSSGERPWQPLAQSDRELRPALRRPRFCNYTPAFVVTFSPLSRLDQSSAFWVWELILFGCIAAAILALARGADPPLNGATVCAVLALTIVSKPMRGTFTFAQATPILVAALAASWFCSRRQRPALAGAFLAAAALLKLFPAAVGGYFLFTRRWRELLWASAFVAAGIVASGVGNWIAFARYGVTVSAGPLSASEMTAFAWVLNVVAPKLGLAGNWTVIVTLTFAIALALISLVAWQTASLSGKSVTLDGLAFGSWMAVALALSPLAWPHERVMLVPIYLFACLAIFESLSRRDRGRSWLFYGGTALVALALYPDLIPKPPLHLDFLGIVAAIAGGSLVSFHGDPAAREDRAC